MPELPEVEFARRSLQRWLRGRTVVRTEAEKKARTFRGSDPHVFEGLTGALTSATRKGKYLTLAFSEGLGVVAHLGMTGKFLRRKPDQDVRWSKARFVLDDGKVIHFQDPRLFGFIDARPVSELAAHPQVAALGVDPLTDDFTVEVLQAAIGKSKQPLKVALMDQGRIAGLGNIHAAEALFRSKLHPSRTADSLSPKEWKALHAAIEKAIEFALEREGEGDDIEYVEEGAPNPFLIYGRAGEPCRRCKTTVESFTQGGRTTHFCPHCQPKTPPRSGKKR